VAQGSNLFPVHETAAAKEETLDAEVTSAERLPTFSSTPDGLRSSGAKQKSTASTNTPEPVSQELEEPL